MYTKNKEKLSGIAEYINALKNSKKFGPQIVFHKYLPEVHAHYIKEASPITTTLQKSLSQNGIDKLFSHQHTSLEFLNNNENIIVSTPTASGKSMIYNLPLLDEIEKNPLSHALYLFPLKALAQDQLRTLEELWSQVPSQKSISKIGAIFDGDTTPYKRKKIRQQPPPVVMTNPEMLHLSLLPYHQRWAHFYKNIKYIVIDEVHTYRGIFGTHMAWVLRRLKRIVTLYGSRPQFILLSATIGNPGELGETLIDDKVRVIEETGAPRAKKHILLLNPWDSAAYTACQLLEAALKRGLRTIVYTQSRKMTELITLWTRPRLGKLSNKLSSYRAGFLPEERREIEANMTDGSLLGVISTSALELGIDIGNLDLCILVGYPGSIMSTWQRGGRVGRGKRESAVVLVAQEDALDQYFMKNPKELFTREVESAILNPQNISIAEQHLHCAAAELPLGVSEPLLQNTHCKTMVENLTQNSILLQSGSGTKWFSTRKFPQRYVHLRGAGSQMTIINSKDGVILGDIDIDRAMKECHPGAIYFHRAKKWVVEKLDILGHEVVVAPFSGRYFTRPISNKSTEIIERVSRKNLYGCEVSFGRLLVRERVTGYQKKNSSTQKLIATLPLELPEQVLETEGVWITLPDLIKENFIEDKLHFMGGLHALEHAMIAMFPLLVLCDRNDIGGISCPQHEQTNFATIFIYDGHNGGVGLAKEAYDKIEQLVDDTYRTIKTCGCKNGCPSCVHSPKCGSGNRPIDKSACRILIEQIRCSKINTSQRRNHGEKKIHTYKTKSAIVNVSPTLSVKDEEGLKKRLALLPAKYGVFDVETKRSALEVGGWSRAERMGISVAVVWDSKLEGHVTYLEHEMGNLVDHLKTLDLVIGFNNKRFDYRVLSAYTKMNLHLLPTLDLLEEVKNQLGYRLSLDRLAQTTLEVQKTGDGLQALQWYKEGKIREICEYCQKDVEITKNLFLHALDEGFLLFTNKVGNRVRLPLELGETIRRELQKTR